MRSDQRPPPSRNAAAEHLRPREHERRRLLREAVLVDEEEHAEPEHRDLRVQVEAAADRQPPELPVADRPRDRCRLDSVRRLPAAKHERTDQRTDRDERGEEEECGLGASRVGDRGQRQRSDQASERDRGLPDAEREAPLVGGEPVHDRAPARRVDGRARGADQPEEDDELGEARGERGGNEEERGTEHPDGERDALAEAVGGEPPRKERQRRPDPGRRQQDADLAEREVELLAQLRHDHRQADPEGRVARRRGRPGREHRPPVAVLVYSANGLIGRVPVETTTLFVSR